MIDDEEDNSRGDLMDFMTPREISTNRYIQHHEWMEEIFNSPYNTSQIVPVELGLGRKGELEALTREFFNAPIESTPTTPSGTHPPRVGKLEPGKAEDFTRKAIEKVAELNAEMEQMKWQHAKRMAKLVNGVAVRAAEKSLRSAPLSVAQSGANDWKFDGSVRDSPDENAAGPDGQKSVDQITADVEALLGKMIIPVQDLKCIHKGGLEEQMENTENNSRPYDFVNPLQGADGLSNQTMFVDAQAPPSAVQNHFSSIMHDPQPFQSEKAHSGAPIEPPKTNETYLDVDVDMGGMPNASESKDLDAGDWVIVNKETELRASPRAAVPVLDEFTDLASVESNTEALGSTLDAVDDVLPSFTSAAPNNSAEEFSATHFQDSPDFESLGAAGEALSGYGPENTSAGLEEHGVLDLDDSGFGEAFHAPQVSPGPQGERH